MSERNLGALLIKYHMAVHRSLMADKAPSASYDAAIERSDARDVMIAVHDEVARAMPELMRPEAVTDPQPMPQTNDHPSIQDLVMADFAARKADGIRKYGTALQPFNGRDPLVDLYQELLDACQYCRQALAERDGQ